MYKLFLCFRYLRTRYLAFICIVSVMLGVATLIVVNSVMSGFSNKLRDRLHGVLADVLAETERSDGFDEPADRMTDRILASPAGRYVEAMSPTVEVFALLQFHVRDRYGRKIPVTKHVRLIGIEHVAISSDFDGGGGVQGWSNAAESANVTIELVRRGYGEEQIAQLWSGNTLRLWGEVERIAARWE